MIEIAEAPDVQACASCMSPIVWLYSYRTGRTFSVVAIDRSSFRVHECRGAQDPVTWRQAYRGDPPTAEYLQVKAKIAAKERP